MFSKFLIVFLGGGAGSVLRYAFGFWLQNVRFPWATFAANVLACFIIGVLSSLYLRGQISDMARLLLVTGFCGGFSTFSTFSNETLQLIQQNNVPLAAANIIGTLGACLVATLLGLILFAR